MKSTSNQIIFSRNNGLLSEDDQDLLAKTSIAIAGTGGDGGLLAERLARFGIGKMILADPEAFEPSNTNRQFAAQHRNFGKNKAEVIAEELLLINPAIEVFVYPEGITCRNVKEIVTAAHIVVDEIEYACPALSVLLHKECRLQNKHVFMGANIGWGGTIFCFDPGGKTFEEHFEFNEQTKTINPIRYAGELPTYVDAKLLDAVYAGEKSVPSLSSAVGIVASVLANEIILFLTNRRKPVVVPAFLSVDLFNQTISKNQQP